LKKYNCHPSIEECKEMHTKIYDPTSYYLNNTLNGKKRKNCTKEEKEKLERLSKKCQRKSTRNKDRRI